MSTLRGRIESGFERFGSWIFDHPWRTLAALAVVMAALFSQLPHITFDSSNESFFHKDDPTMSEYDAFREQFGREEVVIIGISPPEVFDAAFLTKLDAFHDALEREVPYVEDVTSLVNVRDTRGEGDQLVVEDLLKTLPDSPEGMAALKERVLASTLYPNFLISKDGSFTVVLLETYAWSPGDAGAAGADLAGGFGAIGANGSGGDAAAAFSATSLDGGLPGAPVKRVPFTPEENKAVVDAVEKLVADYDGPDFPITLAGGPVMNVFFDAAMQKDMGTFMGLAVLAIGTLLLVLFRRLIGVMLPLLVVLLAVVSTISLMALTGTAFTMPTTILPSFLLAVGVGSCVHLLTIFFRRFGQTEDKRGSLSFALGHSGMPIFMTGLTTATGLLSFSTAELAPIADLGIFAGLGVLTSLVYTLVLVPALLAVLPMRARPRLGGASPGAFMDRILVGIADFSTGRPWTVVSIWAVVGVVSVVGLTRLSFSQNFLEWIPEEHPIRQNIERIDGELDGSVALEVVVDTQMENGLYEPKVMKGIEQLATFTEGYANPGGKPFVGKTNSVVNVLKETNRALNENRASAYALPDSRELNAQELLLFENSGSDDLTNMVDSLFSKARLSIMLPNDDAAVYVNFVRDVEDKARDLFDPGTDLHVTGMLNLWTSTIYNMMYSMARSYLVAGVVITALMMLLIGSVRIGALSMVANFAPIVVVMGMVMGFLNIRLDGFTLLIGSIALGLAVDDTIHFFHNFRRYYGHKADVRYAVRETLLGSGRAMVFTTIALVTGFWLFLFATLNNNQNFGFLTGLALIFALAADFFLAPAMLALVVRTSYGKAVTKRWSQAVAP